MIGIIDYGVGNIGSIRNGLEFLKIPYVISHKTKDLSSCQGIILPGVGAFESAIKKLKSYDLVDFIKDYSQKNKKLLGICLGMQLLLEKSYEGGEHKGLCLIEGSVEKIKNSPRKIHIGWNKVESKNNTFKSGYGYFVHSYKCVLKNQKLVLGETFYGEKITAVFNYNNILGIQFHPEKSQTYGLSILKNFYEQSI
tara:strand:- start:840 stop:1427 length:588 start_codon:yes stop_codon:yes gene_type:complete